MSTVKISQLPDIPGGLNANTSNSLFLGVDIPTGVTGKFTATQLAERLYANNVLNVGDNTIVLPNVVAQFSGLSNTYIQVNLENDGENGSSDYVATADTGTDTTHYVDLGINNSGYASRKLDGYLVVAGGASASDPGGNLMLGSITTGKTIEFVVGGVEDGNVVAKLYSDGAFELRKKQLIFADATTQNTAASPANYSEAAYAQSNTNAIQVVAANNYAHGAYARANAANNLASSGYAQANAANNMAVSAYVQANAANNLAVSAYAKANSALANTSGTFAGDLIITGNTNAQAVNTANLVVVGTANVSGTLNVIGNVTMDATTYMTGGVTVNSTMVLANSNFSASEAAFRITAAGSSQPVTQAGTLMQLTSKANTPARMLIDSFGTSNTAYPIIAGRAARGTVDAPTATQNNDILLRIAGNSYGTTGYAPFGDARIDFVASETHSDTNRGSRIRFWNTPNGSNVVNEIASFNADSVYFTGVLAPQKGFIHTPNVQSTLTTLNIDFDRDSLIKFNVTADASITLSNYVYGKVIEVWITNSAAQNKTITHGCLANNSTSKATTFTITSQSCAYLRYFSIDGDQANTFVSITA